MESFFVLAKLAPALLAVSIYILVVSAYWRVMLGSKSDRIKLPKHNSAEDKREQKILI